MPGKIMYVTQFVNDHDQALDFYASALGFKKRVDFEGPEVRFLTIALEGQVPELLLEMTRSNGRVVAF
jgi:hypothetical protein